MDDKEIIEGILKKDTAALKQLINKYGSLIYNVAASILNQSHEKQDIDECVDDILLCLWNYVDSFSMERGNFKVWLIAVAKHKALNYKKKLRKALDNVDIDDQQIHSDDDLESEYINKDKKKQILSLLNNLNKTDKEVFVRKYLKDEGAEEIATKMKLTPMAVYNRLSRGRKKLKKIISDGKIDIE